jgi:hypothetical protein
MDMYGVSKLEKIKQLSKEIEIDTDKLAHERYILNQQITSIKQRISDIGKEIHLKNKPLLELCVNYRMLVMDQNCSENNEWGTENNEWGICDGCDVLDICPSCKKDFSE